MSVDIDHFIRAQKQKIAEERQGIGPYGGNPNPVRSVEPQGRPAPGPRKPPTPEKPIVDRLIEGDLQHQRYLLERQRQTQHRSSSPKMSSSRRPGGDANGGAALFGLRNSATTRKMKQEQRNQEYNDFKRQEEEKFRNRFSEKKNTSSDYQPVAAPRPVPGLGPIGNEDHQRMPRRRSEEVQFSGPPAAAPPIQEPHNPYNGQRDYQNGDVRPDPRSQLYESKVDELMRQVEELRRGNSKLANNSGGVSSSGPVSRHAMPTEYEPSFYPPGALDRRQAARRPPPAAKPTEEDGGASLPIGDRLTEDARKRQLRNQEYNDFLKAKADLEMQRNELKRYGQSHSYEDALTQRRLEREGGLIQPEVVNGVALPPPAPRRGNESYDQPADHHKQTSMNLSPILKAQLMKLNEVEQRLRELEATYDNTKVQIFTKRDQPKPRDPMADILDDEVMFGAGLDALSRYEKGAAGGAGGFKTTRGRLEQDGATLAVGRPDTPNTRKRRQELYRRELEIQMKEQAEARKRQFDDNYVKDGKALPGGESRSAQPMNRSRSAANLNRLEPISQDDPYFYYAQHNPLEATEGTDEYDGRQPLEFRRQSQPGGLSPEGARRVHFDSSDKSKNASAMVFLSDEDQKRSAQRQKMEYAQQLRDQMQRSEIERQMRKKKQDELDRKKEEEIANYNPYGKGGGGAPMRDPTGNVVADLRGYKPGEGVSPRGGGAANVTTRYTPRLYADNSPPRGRNLSISRDAPPYANTPRARSQSPTQTNAFGEVTHARGGHGIFGDPLSDDQKNQLSRYQADLQKQIAEQKRRRDIEKQKEREEEEREMKRIQEQQKKMALELEEEQRKKREKEEESRRMNEEAKLLAEQKRKEMEAKRQEEETRRLRNLQDEQQRRPVYEYNPTDEGLHDNRPLPTQVARPPPRFEDEDPAFSQLSELRRQIEAERRKVEAALEQQRHHVDVYDPRLEPVTEVVVSSREPREEDVFQRVIHKHKASPLVHRISSRDSADAERRNREKRVNRENVEEFKKITAQRRRPLETPDTDEKLETQQQHYLHAQEEKLERFRRGKERPEASRYPPKQQPVPQKYHQQRPPTGESMQLQSESAFLEIAGPEAPLDNGHATYRRQRRESTDTSLGEPRRQPQPSPSNSNSVFGSQTSLNVDELTRKNEERMRKLQRMQADNASLADHEEVLNRFMSRQPGSDTDSQRPPSQRLHDIRGFNDNDSQYQPPGRNLPSAHSDRNAMDESWMNPSRLN